jgi:hypothetical protein
MDPERLVGYQLWVRFLDEDGEPAVLFVPFVNQGSLLQGMKCANGDTNRRLWYSLVSKADRANLIVFRIQYCFEPIQTAM